MRTLQTHLSTGILNTKILCILLFICFSNSCKEEDPIPSDYRDKYVGIYSCEATYTYEGSTRIFQDTLKVFKNGHEPYDISIHIKNMEGNWVGYDMTHNEGGSFYGYHSNVTFTKDKIHYTENGPLGAYYSLVYDGYKINP